MAFIQFGRGELVGLGRNRVQGAKNRYLDIITGALLGILKFYHLPVFLIIHQFSQHILIEKMPGFFDYKVTDYWIAENSKISDEVQDFVPHKLVLVSQPILINDSEVINDNSIIQRSAFCQSVFP